MALETATYVANLVVTNPDGGDQRSTADDHIRLIKASLRRTFPNLDGAVSLSAAQVMYVGDLSASVQLQLNTLREGSATANNAINARYANSASYAASAGVAAAVLASDGSVGAPSIAFGLDPNTGLYRISGDVLGIATGGVLKAQFSAGTVSEQQRWIGRDATGDNYVAWFRNDNTTRKGYLGYGNAGDDTFWINNEESGVMIFGIQAGEAGRILNSATTAAKSLAWNDGAVGTPSFTFSGDTDTGIYHPTTDSLGITTGGTLRITVSTTAITSTLPILNQDGSAGSPSYTFSGDTDTGMYRAGSNNLAFVAGSTIIFDITATLFTLNGTIVMRVNDGAVGAPGLSWRQDTDTGIYRIGADNLGVAVGGALVLDFIGASSGGARVADFGGTLQNVGYREIPQNAQSDSYSTVLADSGKHIYHPVNAGPAVHTIPANSVVAYPIGTALTFVNDATATVSIAIATDTLAMSPGGTTGTRALARYGVATAIKVTSTRWLISGSGLA